MKQKYNKPTMQIVRIDVTSPIMSGSGPFGLPSQTELPGFDDIDTRYDDDDDYDDE